MDDLVNICDDLLMDILSRLPPKHLAVCKCVSKSWLRLVSTLIHSPARPRPMTGLFVHFIDGYNEHGAIEFFNQREDVIDVVYSLSFLPCHPDTRLLDCRDGHLLCSSIHESEQDNYFVCNPITRQWVSLPDPPVHVRIPSVSIDVNVALVLEESDSCCFHFKVIRFVSHQGSLKFCSFVNEDEGLIDNLYVDVYSSQTGKWEASKAFIEGIGVSLLERPSSVYMDGVLLLSVDYFFRFLRYDVKEERCDFLCCDVKEELTDDLKVSTSLSFNCLGKSRGCLHYAYNDGYKMEVWMVEGGDTSEWVLKHSVKLDDIDFPEPSVEEDYRTLLVVEDYLRKESLDILAFHPNLDVIFIRKRGDFSCYNYNTKAVEKVKYYYPSPAVTKAQWPFRVYPFSDCLLPLVDAHQRT